MKFSPTDQEVDSDNITLNISVNMRYDKYLERLET